MQKTKFLYITPRIIHNEQDKSRQKKLKKLNEIINNYPKQESFFFDKSRFSTHSKVKHG